MNKPYYPSNDLEVALMFLPELDVKHLNLVVTSHQHLPFIRRALYNLLGQPNRAMPMDLIYSTFTIKFFVDAHPMEGSYRLKGLPESNTFLVETWGDNNV